MKMSSNDFEACVADGKNKNLVKCKQCASKILLSKAADYVETKMDLPLIQQKDLKLQTETEAVQYFFHVKDMYTFENIGFSHLVDNKKYLCCADCETGPLGFFDTTTKESYLALSRVDCS